MTPIPLIHCNFNIALCPPFFDSLLIYEIFLPEFKTEPFLGTFPASCLWPCKGYCCWFEQNALRTDRMACWGKMCLTQGDLFQTLKETWVPLRREWDTLKRGRGSAGDRAGHAGTWFMDPSLCLLALVLVIS